MRVGGWKLLAIWLSTALTKADWPLIQQILQVLNVTPVNKELLNIANMEMIELVGHITRITECTGMFCRLLPCYCLVSP